MQQTGSLTSWFQEKKGGCFIQSTVWHLTQEWKTNPPTSYVKAGFPPRNSEDLRFHYRKATYLYAWKKRPSKCNQLQRRMWFSRAEANWNEPVVSHSCYSDQWGKHIRKYQGISSSHCSGIPLIVDKHINHNIQYFIQCLLPSITGIRV